MSLEATMPLRRPVFRFCRTRRLRTLVSVVSTCLVSLLVFKLSFRSLISGSEHANPKTSLQFDSTFYLHRLYGESESRWRTDVSTYRYMAHGTTQDFAMTQEKQCDERFVIFGSMFAILQNITVNPDNRISVSIPNQAGSMGDNSVNSGYFELNCSSVPLTNRFKENDYRSTWLRSTVTTQTYRSVSSTTMISGKRTIFVQRSDNADLYYTMTDLYNAFLVLQAFHIPPKSVDIVWMDDHPHNVLDSLWSTSFGNVSRARSITTPVLYRRMAWGMPASSSPLWQTHYPDSLHLEEFRDFFLRRYELSPSVGLKCTSLSVLFAWRRDHTKRLGQEQRKGKVGNEWELIEATRARLPGSNVLGFQLDYIPMKYQLLQLSKSHILVGVHGTDLTHALLMPAHGGLIELFPMSYDSENTRYRDLAEKRGLHYLQWVNRDDPTLETSESYTYIPPDQLTDLVVEMRNRICGN